MRVKTGQGILCIRVAGICIDSGRVLLHQAEGDFFWALPGGGIEFSETAPDALMREFKEEIDAEIQVGSLSFFVENFFRHMEQDWHEIGMYLQFQFSGRSTSYYQQESFSGSESSFIAGRRIGLLYRWFPLSEIERLEIKPSFLKTELLNLTPTPKFLSHRDLQTPRVP